MLLQIEGASRGNSHPVYASNKKPFPRQGRERVIARGTTLFRSTANNWSSWRANGRNPWKLHAAFVLARAGFQTRRRPSERLCRGRLAASDLPSLRGMRPYSSCSSSCSLSALLSTTFDRRALFRVFAAKSLIR